MLKPGRDRRSSQEGRAPPSSSRQETTFGRFLRNRCALSSPGRPTSPRCAVSGPALPSWFPPRPAWSGFRRLPAIGIALYDGDIPSSRRIAIRSKRSPLRCSLPPRRETNQGGTGMRRVPQTTKPVGLADAIQHRRRQRPPAPCRPQHELECREEAFAFGDAISTMSSRPGTRPCAPRSSTEWRNTARHFDRCRNAIHSRSSLGSHKACHAPRPAPSGQRRR